ncbi:MAG: aminoglycoside phosphotransferase family protein [Patescibacteria group bacterium]
MNKDLEFLLNKSDIQSFLSTNVKDLFGEDSFLEVLELERAYTYNNRAYNVFYKIKVGDQVKDIRASASLDLPKEKEFKILSFIYNHGFNNDEILVPKPLAFFKEYNLFFYESLPGETLIFDLKNKDLLDKKIRFAAKALKKFHTLPKPDFELWDAGNFLNYKDFEGWALFKFYPNLAKSLNEIVAPLKEKIYQQKSDDICHGDYQPANLIFFDHKIFILDFGTVCLLDREYDVASFINQLEIMLKRYGDIATFENLKKEFLAGYGDFNREKFDLYTAMLHLRILVTFCFSQGKGREDNSQFIPEVYNKMKKSFNKIGIKVVDD